MNRITSAGTAVAAVLIATLPLSACGPVPDELSACPDGIALSGSGGLGIIVPVHRGAPSESVSPAAACLIEQAIAEERHITVVTSEGTPQVILDMTYELDHRNGSRLRLSKQKAEDHLQWTIASAKASSDGNDLLTAIARAAQGTRTGTILALDNGITDAGAVQTTQPGLIYAEPDAVAAAVQSQGSCPPLEHDVIFDSLGATTAPQPALAIPQSEAIGHIYETVATVCGATSVSLTGSAISTADGPETAHVMTILEPPTTDGVDLCGQADCDDLVAAEGPVTVTFDDTSALGFLSDSTDYRSAGDAAQTVRAIADQLKQHPDLEVVITGRTANGSTAWESLEALGLARATAVRDDLVAQGIPTSRIDVVGLGYMANPPQVDAFTAAQNRAIDMTVSR